MTIKYLETFSGIGGFRAALEQAIRERIEQGLPVPGEFECVGHSDILPWADRIYRKHWPETPNLGDITQLDTGDLGDIDLLLGGFPCQAFSVAGNKLGFEDTRGTLFFDLARILADKNPRYFVFENVRGLLSHDSGRTFAAILGVLADLGYRVEWQVLNSKDHGVPQNRERVVLIGRSGDKPGRAVLPLRVASNPYGTVGFEAEAAVARTLTGGGNSGGHHSAMTLIQEDYFFDRNLRRADVYRTRDQATCIDANYPKGLDDHGQRSGVAEIRSGVARVRRLTPLECERLQGFPDGWTAHGLAEDGQELAVPVTARYKVLGNAVTVNVFVAVFHRLLEEWATAGTP